MDRLDFTSHINYNVPVDKEQAISKHFDEIMSLYDIIGIIEASIDASIEEELMTFNIRTKNSQERSIMLNRLSTFTVNKYGHNYYAEPKINNDYLTVILKEKQ